MHGKEQQDHPERYYQLLCGKTLSRASRSLYISFKFLPNQIKPLVCLFYLLGRSLDTIADTPTIPASERLKILQALLKIMKSESELETIEPIMQNVLPQLTKTDERDLLSKLPLLLKWLATMPQQDKDEIIKIMELILLGDQIDLETFNDPTQILSLRSEEELLQYCYYQASGIAEVANQMFFRHISNYASLDENKMKSLANQSGNGMQLINILRDLPADLRDGRCYLPMKQLESVGLSPEKITTESQKLIPILNYWHNKILTCLDAQLQYILAVNNKRLRYGGTLALLINVKTLILLKDIHYIKEQQRVKLSRNQIKKMMLIGLLSFISKKFIKSYYLSLRKLAAIDLKS